MRRAPAAYMQAVRVEAAKAMLEREATSIQDIANAVGYQDASFFRTLFKRETGISPADYRAQFAAIHVREPEVVDLSALD